MQVLEVTILVLGVFFSILLLAIVWALWRYIERTKDKNVKNGHSGGRLSFSSTHPEFDIPVSYRTVKAQQPFLKTELYDANSTASHRIIPKKNLLQDMSSSPNGSSEVRTDGYETCSDASLPPPESPKTKRLQSDIMAHLQVLSRGARSSVSDWSDLSGSEVANEVFESASAGSQKKRVARRRHQNTEKSMYVKSGQVTFRVSYQQNTLTIHILRLIEIAPKLRTSDVNPFVRMYLQPGKRFKKNTKFQKGTQNPYIDEKFEFNLLTEQDLTTSKLKLKVYNHNKLRSSQLLGEVDIPLNAIDLHASETLSVDLFSKLAEKSQACISISLCHEATFNKLEVVIHEAKNLRKISQHMNTYAIVVLFKDDHFDRKETAVVTNSCDPKFNETLQFKTETSTESPLSNFSLVVSLANKRHIGKDQIIGHVIFTPQNYPQSAAAKQWLSVSEMPHKRLTEWHSLIAPTSL